MLPFDALAIDEIARISKGNPRAINALCDSSLLEAFAEGSTTVNTRQVLEAATDLQLISRRQAPLPAAPATATAMRNGRLIAPPIDALEAQGTATSPIRVPDFCTLRPPLIARWAIRLKLAHARGAQ